jgi:hypothetical protein
VQSRIFLLSPANCGGRRAQQVLSPRASFPLAVQLQSRRGAPLGDVFAFVSGLYFRGKLTYARRFAVTPDAENNMIAGGVYIITPNSGLRSPDTLVNASALRGFAGAEVASDNLQYRRPLERSARTLLAEVGPDCDIVLLGSIASAKYTGVLGSVFGDRLRFPVDFVGRGDMSRGGLLLRSAAAGCELDYVPVAGAILHGVRPPRLPPLPKVQSAGVQSAK